MRERFVVEFFSPLEELALRRSNQAIRNTLNVIDGTPLSDEDKARIRKIIVDEINEMRRDFLEYFTRVRDA